MTQEDDLGKDEGKGRTIDQIAQLVGLPASTIRLYQNKGLLPPPEKRGRVGYYDEDHVGRLHLISSLQDRGFSLAAIKETLDSWNSGRSVSHLLGVSDIAPGLDREPLRLSMLELAERFDGLGLTQPDLQRAVEIGLVEIDGTDVLVSSEAFADIGPAFAKLGVPVGEILDEYEALAEAVRSVAGRFKDVFERHIWEPFAAKGMPPEEIPSITSDVAQLAELATAVVTTELNEQFATFAAEYFARAESREQDI